MAAIQREERTASALSLNQEPSRDFGSLKAAKATTPKRAPTAATMAITAASTPQAQAGFGGSRYSCLTKAKTRPNRNSDIPPLTSAATQLRSGTSRSFFIGPTSTLGNRLRLGVLAI